MPLWTSMPSKVPLGCPNPTIPLMSPTIPHAPSDMYELPRQFLINLMISHFPWVTNIPGNGGFHRNPSISHTAHHESSNKWVQVPVTAFKSSTHSTWGQWHRSKNNESNVPCHQWLVPFPRFPMYSKMTGSISSNFNVWLVGSTSSIFQYDWQLPGDGGFSVLAITTEWSLHPDWQQPGNVVPPPWPSQLNGVSTQTGSTQVMWFLRSDHHSWMVSPPRLVTPRWCGSSALTITAEWHLLPDWQHPGDVVPPLWPSQLNDLPT